jgi:hypothetical protein
MSEYLGEFEQIVLLAIVRLGEGAYGVSVTKSKGVQTGALVSERSIQPWIASKPRDSSILGLQSNAAARALQTIFPCTARRD